MVTTVHIPYMNSATVGERHEKKKKKNARNLKRSKRNVDPNSTLKEKKIIYIKRHSKHQLKEKIYIFIYIKRQSKLCTTSSVKT